MANIAIIYDDKVVGGVLTASTELPTLPAINLQNPFLSPNRWRSSANTATINVDFTGTTTIGGFILANTNLTAAATFRMRLSPNSDMSSPVYDTGAVQVAGGVDVLYGDLIHIIAVSGWAARYMRIDLTDATLSYIEGGRLFAGKKFAPSRGFAPGWRDATLDSTRFAETEGGQTWVDVGVLKREMRLRLHALTDAEVNGEYAAIRRLGRRKDILVVLDTTSPNLGRDSIFGLIAENLSLERQWPDLASADFVILERK